MALIKKITLPSGHECSYWRVIEVQTKHLSKDGSVTIIGYKDKATRDAGFQPLADSAKTFYGYHGHGGTEEAYEWLRSLTETVPDQMVDNPEYDPEIPPMLLGLEDADGNPLPPQPNPDYKGQHTFIPAHTVPGVFADAKSDT
jgi:hypothetical protein